MRSEEKWSMLVDKEQVFEDLDDLRESGEVNMFGAAERLRTWYPELTVKQARAALAEWMETFGERHAD